MKRSIIAFILVILICIPLLASCSKKKDTSEQPTDVPMTEEITQKPTEAPTEEPTDPPTDNKEPDEQTPTPEPDKFVMDYTVAKRIYSYYSAEYGIIGVALNKYDMPLAINVYGDDLTSDISHSFCTMQYDESGKLTSLTFPKNSIMHEQIFNVKEDLAFEISRHDKKDRPLKTLPLNFATISFDYDDEAKTSSIVFTHVYHAGAYTLTFDEHNRLLLVDDFGNWSKNEYTEATAIHTEKDFASNDHYELSYDSKILTKLDANGTSYKYTFNESGFCSSADIANADGNTSRKNMTYDQKNRMTKIEGFTLEGETATKDYEFTWAYDLYDKITEYKEFYPNENGELVLTNSEQYAYTETGILEAKILISYDENGYKSFESVNTYNDDGSYLQTNTTYSFYQTLISETIEYDVLGRPTHVFTSHFDVNQCESETISTAYEYSDIDGDYIKITRKYSYSLCLSQTTETYVSGTLREKEIITYDENMNVKEIETTIYDKDGNEII